MCNGTGAAGGSKEGTPNHDENISDKEAKEVADHFKAETRAMGASEGQMANREVNSVLSRPRDELGQKQYAVHFTDNPNTSKAFRGTMGYARDSNGNLKDNGLFMLNLPSK